MVTSHWAYFISVSLAVVVLSGCLGGDDAPSGSDDNPFGDDGLPYSQDTGAIWVAVSSDQFMPLEGARVQVLDMGREPTDHEVTTRADGESTVRFVEPGDYIVFVTAIGFESTQRALTVNAGAITEVRVVLTKLPETGPYAQEFDRNGHVTYAAAWQVEPPGVGCITIESPVGIHDPKSCGGIRGGGGDAGETRVGPEGSGQNFMEADLSEMKTVVVEMRWNPAGPLGEHFLLDLMCADVPRGAGGAVLDIEHDCYFEARGGSPLVIRVDEEHWLEHGYNFTGTWAARVFATYGMLGTYGPTGVDAGVAWEQSFEKYWTVFHREPAPEGFSRLPDA